MKCRGLVLIVAGQGRCDNVTFRGIGRFAKGNVKKSTPSPILVLSSNQGWPRSCTGRDSAWPAKEAANEDPRAIVEDMVKGMKTEPIIIMDRRKAIAHAVSLAQPGDAILLTGKGTDPSICRANGTEEPWNEYEIAREIVRAHLKKERA